MNDPQALFINYGYLKYFSSINLPPTDKSLVIISFILYF